MSAEHDAELDALAQTIYNRVHGHEWKPTFMTDATECFEAASAILAEFMPAHDKRVREEQQLHDAVLARNVADKLAYHGLIELSEGAYHAAAAIREASDE